MASTPAQDPPWMRRILAPTDFSASAASALRWAESLRQVFRAELVILHVIDLGLPGAASLPMEPAAAAAFGRMVEALQAEARQGMEALATRAPQAQTEIRHGVPRTVILEVAAAVGADLIVMGTHGRTGLAHLVLGSVAEHVVRHSPIPVLTVPSAGSMSATTREEGLMTTQVQVRRILVPTDFSPGAGAALDWAMALAGALGAAVTVLHVLDLSALAGLASSAALMSAAAELVDRIRAATEQEMAGLVERVPGVASMLREGTPRQVILQAAGEIQVDLIVMGTHGRTGLAHVIFGSVAEHVVRHSPVPVLTVRRAE